MQKNAFWHTILFQGQKLRQQQNKTQIVSPSTFLSCDILLPTFQKQKGFNSCSRDYDQTLSIVFFYLSMSQLCKSLISIQKSELESFQ